MSAQDGRWQALLQELVRKASHGNTDIIWGKALGPSPRYFIVGDQPIPKDYIVGAPFSGGLQPILTKALITLGEKFGTKPEECYITYVVKTTLQPQYLTEEAVLEEWLPALQVEFQLSGCKEVVCIGKFSRLIAALVSQKPQAMGSYKPGIMERIKKAAGVLLGR